jgi:ribose transport system permease protein
MSASTSAQPATGLRGLWLDGAQRWWRRLVPYLGFVIVFAFFAIDQRSHGFSSVTNLKSIIEQVAPVAVMAMGYTFTLGGGEIDLSIGATVALVALTSAQVMQAHGPLAGVLAGVATGLVIGLVNGLLTVFLRVPSFLITLGTTSVITGLAQRLTNLQAVAVSNRTFDAIFGSGSVGPIPSLLIWVVGVLVVGHVVLRRTRFGRHVMAVGGSREAATSLGLPVRRIRVSALVISALAGTLAGLLYTGRLQGASYTLGATDLLTVIAATIIGGTSLFGGRSSVPGALIGALLLGVLQEGLVLMGLGTADQLIAEGLVVVVAVGLSLRERAD